jgi:hypothetical protein
MTKRELFPDLREKPYVHVGYRCKLGLHDMLSSEDTPYVWCRRCGRVDESGVFVEMGMPYYLRFVGYTKIDTGR